MLNQRVGFNDLLFLLLFGLWIPGLGHYPLWYCFIPYIVLFIIAFVFGLVKLVVSK